MTNVHTDTPKRSHADAVQAVAEAIHRVKDPDKDDHDGHPWTGDATWFVAALDAYNGKINPRDAVPAWQPKRDYLSMSNDGRGDYVRQRAVPAVGNERVFRCTTSGRSGDSEPAWQLAQNATTVDGGGTLIWTECTAEADAYGKAVQKKDEVAKTAEAAKVAVAKAEAAKAEAVKTEAEAEAAKAAAAKVAPHPSEALHHDVALTPHPSEVPHHDADAVLPHPPPPRRSPSR
jgi:hypothetical protein